MDMTEKSPAGTAWRPPARPRKSTWKRTRPPAEITLRTVDCGSDRPAVLYADEPSGNLDSATKQEIHKLFFDMRERHGQTIVIVTHDPDLAALCDRSLTMRDGSF